MAWAELCKLFSSAPTPRAEKDGLGWAPVEFDGKRSTSTFKSSCAVVLDFDKAPDEKRLLALSERLKADGVASFWHTTFTKGNWRAIFPVERQMDYREHVATWRALVAKYEIADILDPTGYQPERFYYTPSVQTGNEFDCAEFEGTLLLVSKNSPDPPPLINEEKLVEGELQPVDLDSFASELLHRTTSRNRSILNRVAQGLKLADKGEHDITLLNLANALVHTAPEASNEAYIAFATRSLILMGWEQGFGHCVGQFTKKIETARRFRRAKEEEKQRKEVNRKHVADLLDEPIDYNTADWTTLLDKTEKGANKSTHKNLAIVLNRDPNFAGHLHWDILDGKISCDSPVIRHKDKEGISLSVDVAQYISRSYGMEFSPRALYEILEGEAQTYPQDRLKEYVESLEWDGKRRIDTWLIDYCAAHTTNALGQDITALIKEFSAKFLIAAISRALVPGSKVHTALILETPNQMAGKSSVVGALGGKFYNDTPFDISSKDSDRLLAKYWFIELAELTSIVKKDPEQVKNFLSRCDGDNRAAYARTHAVLKRRCVFIGTTNEGEYLKDDTGNRRFWTVRCGPKIDHDGLEAVRDQLFAEAKVRYMAGEKWYLSPGTEAYTQACSEAALRLPTVPFADDIIDIWKRQTDRGPIQVLTMARLLGIEPNQANKYPLIGKALNALGFTLRWDTIDGTRVKRWHPSEEFAKMPTVKNGVVLATQTQTQPSEKAKN